MIPVGLTEKWLVVINTEKCNHCHKGLNGGMNQLKYPVGHLSKDLKGCPNVPTKVRQEMLAHLQITAKKEKGRNNIIELAKLAYIMKTIVVIIKNDNIRELKRKMRVSREGNLQERAHLDEPWVGADASRLE